MAVVGRSLATPYGLSAYIAASLAMDWLVNLPHYDFGPVGLIAQPVSNSSTVEILSGNTLSLAEV